MICTLDTNDVAVTVFTDEGFVEQVNPEPNRRHFLVIEIGSRDLERFGKFEYFICKGESAKTWWIDGMQKWVARTIFLVMDDPKTGDIFIMYYVLNDPKFTQFLGKLNRDCALYQAAYPKFISLDYAK